MERSCENESWYNTSSSTEHINNSFHLMSHALAPTQDELKTEISGQGGEKRSPKK